MKNHTKYTISRSAIGLIAFVYGFVSLTWGARLAEFKIVDEGFLMVHLIDGEVFSTDDDEGPCGHKTICDDSSNDIVVSYGNPVNIENAVNTASWVLKSDNDPNYPATGSNVSAVFRKSKMNGMAIRAWSTSTNDYTYEHTMEHTFYLQLPNPLQQDSEYTLEIAPTIESDTLTSSFTFNLFDSPSEAVHVNLCGYSSEQGVKAADLYLWMGDGGARDYSSFEGRKVYLKNLNTEKIYEVGTVEFWKENARETHNYWMTQSDVWNADFDGLYPSGKYRLGIEGVGSSEDFLISPTAYSEPYRISVLGYYFMRIGEEYIGSGPVPRLPLYIPEVSPANTLAYITDIAPGHPDWSETFWDQEQQFDPYIVAGSPTNPNAFGGHSDALDWDRHLGHVSIIWDMLLPYILTDGKLHDDGVGITESGNGIPDIIDEARNEVDFWLNLRHESGYSHGLSNPTNDNVLYQAGNTPIAAWANAANCAILAEAYRIAGDNTLMIQYTAEAEEAYNDANALPDPMLDTTQDVGNTALRGRDFKMMAAAYLYNVTGNTDYEDVVNAESVVNSPTSEIFTINSFNQLWATAAYLKTPQTVNYPGLQNNMKDSIIYRAKAKEANYSQTRPSRRGTDNTNGYWRTAQFVHRTIVAHSVVTEAEDRSLFLNALILEADWGLGRNPGNMIQMTTASTSLAHIRSPQNIYTSGGNDGVPGMHPGHTPYLNTDDWDSNMIMGSPSWMSSKSYPSFDQWPAADSYFNTRHVWAHSEFTPQQTMRGKMALYGYLYGLEKSLASISEAILPHIKSVHSSDDLLKINALTFSGLNYSMEVSNDMKSWSDEKTDIDGGDDLHEFTTALSTEQASKFVRLKAEP